MAMANTGKEYVTHGVQLVYAHHALKWPGLAQECAYEIRHHQPLLEKPDS